MSIIPFHHNVLDRAPLTGMDCCTDVLALGDINGDGHPDVVLGSQQSRGAGLVWYEYPGWERHEVARGEFTTDGTVADLNGDGLQDIIVGDDKVGLRFFENVDRGRTWKEHLIGAGYVHDVATGDVDGDGRLDIVTCNKKGVVLWKQSGAAWMRTVLLTSDGEGITLADMDDDRDLDVVFGGRWLENDGADRTWRTWTISQGWPADTRVKVADMNRDGTPDVVLTASEGNGKIAWFTASSGPKGAWREHRISGFELEGAHSLAVADLDNDGDLDVVTAEMHTSRYKRILNFINDGDDRWRSQTLATAGSHNMQAADLDGDGDINLVGKNYAGAGRVLETWHNLSRDNFGEMSPSAAPFVATGWKYFPIDDERDDDQRGKMGLLSVDANHDGRLDVIGGSFLYLNPGSDLARKWARIRVGRDIDTFLAVDVDGDESTDLIAARANSLLWLEASDSSALSWSERRVADVPDARTQGYVKAQLESGGCDELVFTRGTTLFYVRIPPEPARTPWPRVTISTETEEEGIAAADIDRDGDVDLFATRKGGGSVVWFENRNTGAENWPVHEIGRGDGGQRWLDRILAADVNQDGRVDVIVSEETQDWLYNASIFWFEGPADARNDQWTRHRIAILRSVNSLDVIDVDRDGDVDIVAAEHTDMRESNGAPNNLTTIYVNAGQGRSWRSRPIEAGTHSSHLGARAFDLNGERDPEIVSLGWNQFRNLHAWSRTH